MASCWLCLTRWHHQKRLLKPHSLTVTQTKTWSSYYISQFLLLKRTIPNPITSSPPPCDLHQWINHRAWSAELRFPPWIRALANDTAQDAWASVDSRKFNIAISLWMKNIRHLSPKCFFHHHGGFSLFFAVYLRIITGTQQIKWHPNLWIQHNPEPLLQ